MKKAVLGVPLLAALCIGACEARQSNNAVAEHNSTTATNRDTSPASRPSTSSADTNDDHLDRFVDTTPLRIQPSVPLVCSPKMISPRDTFELSMQTPHGNYLTVKAPD